MEKQRIVIKENNSGVVYEDKFCVIMWLPGHGGYWEADGEWAQAVMITLTAGKNYNTVSFRANDFLDLQVAIDEYFYDMPGETDNPPSLSNR